MITDSMIYFWKGMEEGVELKNKIMGKNDMPKNWVTQVEKICKEKGISYALLIEHLKNLVVTDMSKVALKNER